MERVRKRDREEETSTVDLPFLTALHDLHENWLLKQSPRIPNAPVAIIDATQNEEDVFNEVDRHLKALLTPQNE